MARMFPWKGAALLNVQSNVNGTEQLCWQAFACFLFLKAGSIFFKRTATDTGIISATSTQNQHLVSRESNKTFTVCKKKKKNNAKKEQRKDEYFTPFE